MLSGVLTLRRERMLGGVNRPAGLLLAQVAAVVGTLADTARLLHLDRATVLLDDKESGRIVLDRARVVGGQVRQAGDALANYTTFNGLDSDLVRLAIVNGDVLFEETPSAGAAPGPDSEPAAGGLDATLAAEPGRRRRNGSPEA